MTALAPWVLLFPSSSGAVAIYLFYNNFTLSLLSLTVNSHSFTIHNTVRPKINYLLSAGISLNVHSNTYTSMAS